jgi:hypothetical protein
MKLLPMDYSWIVSFHTGEEGRDRARHSLKNSNIHSPHILFAVPATYDRMIRTVLEGDGSGTS